jgi:hypothetical protein
MQPPNEGYLRHLERWIDSVQGDILQTAMLGIPIDLIDYAAVVRFLETGVREGFGLEFKSDFPKHLDKTIAALANTYGGTVLIGIEETPIGSAQVPIRGIELVAGLRERVLQIGLESIYPPIIPEVKVVEFRSAVDLPEPDRALLVIRVLETDVGPHVTTARNTVYLRADNISGERERKAALDEIEWLLKKRQRSSEEKTRILTRASERALELRPRRRNRRNTERYSKEGTMTFLTVPTFPRSSLLDIRAWTGVVEQTRVSIAALPNELPNGRLRRVAGGLLFEGDCGSSEFQQQGLILHEFDYWWNYYGPYVSPGARQLYPEVTAALFWGALELSSEIYRKSHYPGLVDFQFNADGLRDAFFARAQEPAFYEPTKLIDSEVTIERRFSVGELEENLMAIARDCQRELYWAFGVDASDKLLDQTFQAVDHLNKRGVAAP